MPNPQKIPVNEPLISSQAKRNVHEALTAGWISSAGPFVDEFERRFAAYTGVKHGIAVSNGTAALHVALLSLGIGPKDEVIVPAFTMAATWMAVIHAGATPVFVDCEPKTFTIDPKLIERYISPKTRAIMPVHIYGHPCDMEAIMTIAKKHNLRVIEDAAEAHGAEYHGQRCGSFGDMSCFSFYANKLISTGEGGMILTNDDAYAEHARRFRDLYHSKRRFIHEKIGYNYRFTNLQAALGCGELDNIEDYIAKKQKMAARYSKGLRSIPGITPPFTALNVKNIYWMYSILVDKNHFGLSRDELRAALSERGIDTRDFFYAPTQQPALKPHLSKNTSFPCTDLIAENGLYLPSGLAITSRQIDAVIQALHEIHLSSQQK